MPNSDDDYISEKTEPELRDETSTNNEKFYEKDYLVQLDDSSSVPAHIKDRQLRDVAESAILRGLRPTARPLLSKTEQVDARNVRLVYKVPVQVAGHEPVDVADVVVKQASSKKSE